MADPSLNAPILRGVQIEALVIMKIIKHCTSTFPTLTTGSLVGLDVGGILQITNSFPLPSMDTSQADAREDAVANAAASAPRSKANTAYQAEMIRMLREVNVDANNVGWYTSTNMGNFCNMNTVENQFFYQKEMGERSVALVYDVGRSSQGSLSVRAFRLSPLFMGQYREGKFTTESLQKSGLRYTDIFTELPITIHNSHILTTLLHELPTPPLKNTPSFPPSLASLTSTRTTTKTPNLPLDTNLDALDLTLDPFLEKHCDTLLSTLDSHSIETNNASYHQRSLAREQAKITAWQTKRKAENAARAASKQSPLPEDEWTRLFKLPSEPSRLGLMLDSAQVAELGRGVDGWVGGGTGKMFGVRGGLVREESGAGA